MIIQHLTHPVHQEAVPESTLWVQPLPPLVIIMTLVAQTTSLVV